MGRTRTWAGGCTQAFALLQYRGAQKISGGGKWRAKSRGNQARARSPLQEPSPGGGHTGHASLLPRGIWDSALKCVNQGSSTETWHPGILLEALHTAALCLAHTRGPDSQRDVRRSAWTTLSAQPLHSGPLVLPGPAGALLTHRLPDAPAETAKRVPGAAGFHGEPFRTMSLFYLSAVPVYFLHCNKQ